MNQDKISQTIATFAILIALLIFLTLVIGRKFMKPALENMYKDAADMIGGPEENINDYYE